jgi:hypothetical protein
LIIQPVHGPLVRLDTIVFFNYHGVATTGHAYLFENQIYYSCYDLVREKVNNGVATIGHALLI